MSLDIEALLSPVSDDSPVGHDLRESSSPNSDYRTLRDVRTKARNNERSALANGESQFIVGKDWVEILRKSPEVFQKQSKDIEVLTWLIEALTRVHGFRGVGEGFRLAAGLIDSYGDNLHPVPDEDGVSSQLISLIGLNGFGGEGTIIIPIKAIPLTEGVEGPYSTWQCEQAFELERVSDPDKKEARIKQGSITRAEIDQAVTETDTGFLLQVYEDIQFAIQEYVAFQDVLNAYCVEDPQPSGKILEALETAKQTLEYIAGDRLVVIDESDTEEGTDGKGQSAPQKQQILDNRDAALRSLRDVAAYFRRTEPHSPIPYAIEQAVYWSQLPLPALIQELIPDENARRKYQNLTGIRKSDD